MSKEDVIRNTNLTINQVEKIIRNSQRLTIDLELKVLNRMKADKKTRFDEPEFCFDVTELLNILNNFHHETLKDIQEIITQLACREFYRGMMENQIESEENE